MVKVIRSFPAPASLLIEAQKASGVCTKEDVTKRLQKDFHDKCYICELKGLQDPQVEHLLPHKNGKYPQRKFDWENLFWACPHCNSVKKQDKYDEGILDCCKEDPEELIYFELENHIVQVSAVDNSNKTAALTAELVNEVFNKTNTGMRTIVCQQRYNALNLEMNKLYDALENLKEKPDSKVVLRMLQALLQRESAFAAFKRHYIRKHKDDYPQLMTYVI